MAKVVACNVLRSLSPPEGQAELEDAPHPYRPCRVVEPDTQVRETAMAKAGKTSMGAGAQGKGDGSGAMTELPEGVLPDNMVLSNRDKSSHSDERGLDSRQVQTDQYRDHVGARRDFDAQEERRAGEEDGGPSATTDAAGESGDLDDQTRGG